VAFDKRLLRSGFVGNGLSCEKVEREAFRIGVEKFANALFMRRFQDESGVMIFLHAIDDLGITVRRCVGVLLPRQGQKLLRVVLRHMRQFVRSLPGTDVELGHSRQKIDAGRSLDDVNNVSAANARGDFQEIYFSCGVGFQEFGVSNARERDRGPASGFGEVVKLHGFPGFARKCARREDASTV